jgi:alanine dehydrogenase
MSSLRAAVLLLTRAEIETLLEPEAVLDTVADAFRALSAGAVTAPPRSGVELPGGALLTMSGRRAGGAVVVKLVGVFPGNVALGLDPHPALICLFDAATGHALALMDGEYVTGIRTAAAAALSVRLLARPDARVLAVIGAGVQARAHLRALAAGFAEVRIAARDAGAGARIAALHPGARVVASAAEAAAGAGVICLTTNSGSPVVRAADVAPGTHVTSVGFAPPGGELDPELVAGGRLFVETRGAFAAPPAGCAELAGLDPSTGTELGEVLLGRAPGRRGRDEITVYKAMGHVAEDAAAAELAYRLARAAGRGRELDL